MLYTGTYTSRSVYVTFFTTKFLIILLVLTLLGCDLNSTRAPLIGLHFDMPLLPVLVNC